MQRGGNALDNQILPCNCIKRLLGVVSVVHFRLQQALKSADKVNDDHLKAAVLSNIAELFFDRNEPDQAIES